jgi:hypothetical protein
MSNDAEFHALARQRLLAVSAVLLEALYEPGAVQVLATLRPADMRPGGARVPGTSYELESPTAARAISGLLALRGVRADALAQALAEADLVARYAMLAGQPPPMLSTLYPHCTPDITVPAADSFEAALQALQAAAEKIFTPGQARRIATLADQWRQQPASVDTMPVQLFVAGFVRNAP